MIYTLGQNVVYRRYQRRKIGKRLSTHKCYEPNKAISTVLLSTGKNGGITPEGDFIQGGGDTAFVVEHMMTQQQRWKEDCRQMEKAFKRFASGGIARTSTSLPPCGTIFKT